MMERNTEAGPAAVSPGLVDAAVAAARERGQDVAEVPLTAIAAAANVSRSTLLRRLGGTRAALDAAVLASGVDPGGRPPVRERAITAAAGIIGERGLGAVTLDAVATAARCSVPSLHTAFHGRDGLLMAVFEHYGPVLGIEEVSQDPPERFEDTVQSLYRALVTAFAQEPRVLPAIVADLLGRPEGPGSRLFEAAIPRLLRGMGGLFSAEIDAGRMRPLPMPVIIQLLLGPPAVHMMVRPALDRALGPDLPSVEDACAMFADGFLRAVAAAPGGYTPGTRGQA